MSSHKRTISVIGLGYVGLPVAVAFGRQAPTIGFDINSSRIKELVGGHDSTLEVEQHELAAADIKFTPTPRTSGGPTSTSWRCRRRSTTPSGPI